MCREWVANIQTKNTLVVYVLKVGSQFVAIEWSINVCVENAWLIHIVCINKYSVCSESDKLTPWRGVLRVLDAQWIYMPCNVRMKKTILNDKQ